MELQEDYLSKANEIFPAGNSSLQPLLIERGEGSYLFDINAKRYIDFVSGIASSPIGHCHAKVIDAISSQSKILTGVNNFFCERNKIELANKIISKLPEGLNSLLFCNSGSEAIEAAMKLARKVNPGRPNFIAFNGGFHGRTFGAMSITGSKASARKDYFPLLPNCFFADYPVQSQNISSDQVILQIESLFEHSCPPASVAAIFVESILTEGGLNVPPRDFLLKLQKLCNRWGILLIVDEIQTGFGRTGKWFACQHTDVAVDVLVFSKGAASGLPFAGLATSRELMEYLTPGSHSSPYGGNPLSCAAALATIKTIEQDRLLERAVLIGQYIKDRLEGKFGDFIEVRGLGLMLGIEAKSQFLDIQSFLKRAQNKGVLVTNCGPNGNTIKLAPALNIPEETLDEALSVFEQILDYEILVAQECNKFKQTV